MGRNRQSLRSATKLRLQQIIRLQALDKPIEEIASLLGLTADAITDLVRTKEYTKVRDEYVKEMYKPVDRVIQQRNTQTLLEEASPDAAEALCALLYDDDPVQRRLAGTAILDRAGHGPIQRRAVRQRIELDPVSAKLLGEAMRESAVDVEFEDVDRAD